MSRYDRYTPKARAMLTTAQSLVRARGKSTCDLGELADALVFSAPHVLSPILESNRVSLPDSLHGRLALELEQAPMTESAGRSIISLTDSLRDVLNRAEAIAGGEPESPVTEHHLAVAAWPFLRKFIARTGSTADGSAPDPESLHLPDAAAWRSACPAARPQPAPLPALTRFTRELTAPDAVLPVVQGREAELQQLTAALLACKKGNALLLGDAGVGKTAIVEALAARIRGGMAPRGLEKARVFELRPGDLAAGTSVHGAFEQRMQELFAELDAHPEVVLFVDEIHQLIQPGNPHNLADILKPALGRGKVRCIGATTQAEFRTMMQRDSAFCRRFQPVTVEEPGVNETRAMLASALPDLEKHHGLKIPTDLLDDVVRLSQEALPNRRFPDKALELLDQAAAFARAAVNTGSPLLTVHEIETAAARLSGVRFLKDSPEFQQRLGSLDTALASRVLGQPEAVEVVARTVRLRAAGLDLRPERPAGAFLFTGSTGVGKTETAHALAEVLHGSAEALIRIDLSEYSEAHTVSRLLGSPAGYIGYGEEPALIGALQRKPHCVLLLDEICKAHPAIHRVLLQALDAGRITDAQGLTVSLRHATIIATANVVAAAGSRLGFGVPGGRVEENAIPVPMMELEQIFSREFLARFDAIVPFRPLTKATAARILRERLVPQAVARVWARLGRDLALTPQIEEAVLAAGFSEALGVRELERAFTRLVLDPLIVKPHPGPAEKIVTMPTGTRTPLAAAC